MDIFEATFSDIRKKQKSIVRLFPSFYDRVAAIGPRGGVKLESQDNKRWIFKVHSGTKSHVWYEVVVSFINPQKLLKKLCDEKIVWYGDKIDRRKLAQRFMNEVDIKLSCNCLAQLYWGGDYILTRKKAKFGKPENRPPKIRNPKQYGAHCKHIEAVFKVLPFYISTLAKWINTVFGNFLKKIENEKIEKEEEGKD